MSAVDETATVIYVGVFAFVRFVSDSDRRVARRLCDLLNRTLRNAYDSAAAFVRNGSTRALLPTECVSSNTRTEIGPSARNKHRSR